MHPEAQSYPHTPVPSRSYLHPITHTQTPTIGLSPRANPGGPPPTNTTGSRYLTEFEEVGLLGSGEFGTVYKCVNRLDGCTYAIKRTKKPFRGSSEE